MSMNLGPLFEPFELHNLKLRNRVAMAPMTRNFSPNGVPGQDVVDYYRRRAEAGVGLDGRLQGLQFLALALRLRSLPSVMRRLYACQVHRWLGTLVPAQEGPWQQQPLRRKRLSVCRRRCASCVIWQW